MAHTPGQPKKRLMIGITLIIVGVLLCLLSLLIYPLNYYHRFTHDPIFMSLISGAIFVIGVVSAQIGIVILANLRRHRLSQKRLSARKNA